MHLIPMMYRLLMRMLTCYLSVHLSLIWGWGQTRTGSVILRTVPLQVGFNDRNIQALCSVGDSTKQKQAGYIGQKGIGFKSVFRITDKPSVHSGGYHIAFDIHSEHGKLNYILPTWVGPQYLPGTLAAAACPELTDELRRPQWRTAIHLPLKASGIRGENGVKFQFEEYVASPPSLPFPPGGRPPPSLSCESGQLHTQTVVRCACTPRP